jgi:hypothetical protein
MSILWIRTIANRSSNHRRVKTFEIALVAASLLLFGTFATLGIISQLPSAEPVVIPLKQHCTLYESTGETICISLPHYER